MRREHPPAPAATTQAELEGREQAAAALARLGAHGELALHDGVCREVRLTLPVLDRRPSPRTCVPQGAVSPDGGLAARCPDNGIEVASTATGELQRLSPGCVPAWRPNGELTSVVDDQVVRFEGCAQPEQCTTTLIPREQLERAARRHPEVPDEAPRVRALVDGVAWLSLRRAVVDISIRLGGRFERLGPLSEIAFFTDGRLERTQAYFRATGGRLGTSPRGTYVTRTPDVILRGDGSQVSLPQHLRSARDFAWSPDERLLALAGPFAVVVLDVASLERYDDTGGGLRSVTIPQPAAALRWQG